MFCFSKAASMKVLEKWTVTVKTKVADTSPPAYAAKRIQSNKCYSQII
jgi:hypothetical protein